MMEIILGIILSTLCYLPVVYGVVTGTSDVIVDLGHGQRLKGVKVAYSNGDHLNKFYSIPYALPPTGDRRFEPPVEALPWSGVKDVKVHGHICPQTPTEQSTYNRSEDCLNLSIFSPDLNGSLPVFFWIHGGGFKGGSQFSDGDGGFVARRGVVSVMINYRLAPFGFLSTGDDVMPGNYGMLDQVLALKWVQKNIRVFGGDPGQVTIAGASAGAHSVDFHIISPLSTGLFHRAIMESGSTFCSSAMERPGKKVKVKDFTIAVASGVGCLDTNSSALLRCLKSADSDRLLLASVSAEKNFGITFIALPRVEKQFGFLPDYPTNIMTSGNFHKVDTLRGYNSGEWSFAVHDADNNGVTRDEFTRYFAAFFQKSSFINDAAINRLVEGAYLANETDPMKIRTSLVKALADMTYGAASLHGLVKTVESSGEANRHYFYQFSYRGNSTSTPEWRGVAHSGERPFVFSNPASASKTTDDKRVGETVQIMWSNFVKYGDPTPTSQSSDLVHWDRFTVADHKMLQVGLHHAVETFPRPFVVSLYQKVVDLMLADTVVGVDSVIIG